MNSMYKPTENNFISKWSEYVLAHGFTAVPNLLLVHHRRLGLKATDLVVIIAVDSFRWTSEDPWPSLEALSKRTGYSPRTLSRSITRLEERGLIRRIKRPGTSNKYDLSPLTDTLESLGANDLMPSHPGHPLGFKAGYRKRTTLSSKEYSPNNKDLRRPSKNNVHVIEDDTPKGEVIEGEVISPES